MLGFFGSGPPSPTDPGDLESLVPESSGQSSVTYDALLGTSTASQLQERWSAYILSTTEELRARASAWRGSERCLPPETAARPPCIVEPLGGDSREGIEEANVLLGLNESVVGRAVEALAASIRAARQCIALAPPLCQRLALFGEMYELIEEDDDVVAHQTPAALLVEFAEFLPDLSRIRGVLDRVASIAEHLLRQLVCLDLAIGDRTAPLETKCLQRFHPRPVLDVLGELLAVLAALDGLVLENSRFRQAHASYSRALAQACTLNMSSEASPQSADGLTSTLLLLQETEPFVGGACLQLCTVRIAAALTNLGTGGPVAALRERIRVFCRIHFEETVAIDKSIVATVTSSPLPQSQDALPSQTLVPWVCVFVLYAAMWKPKKGDVKDMRLIADLWRMQRRAPVLLYGRVTWCLGVFLQTHCSALIAEAGLRGEDLSGLRRKQASKLDEGSFAQEMQRLRFAVQGWLVCLSSASGALGNGQVSRALKESQAALRRGFSLALRTRSLLEEYLVLHTREQVPIPRSCLASVTLGFALLRSIEAAPRASSRWTELAALLRRHLALRFHCGLEEQLKKLGRVAANVVEPSQLALRALYLSVGEGRQAELEWHHDVGAIALCCAGFERFLTASPEGHWRELRLWSRWEPALGEICDTSWCYWFRQMFPELLSHMRSGPKGILQLPLLCAAFGAPLEHLVPHDTLVGKAYVQDLLDAIGSALAEPIARSVEANLRMHAHAAMQAIIAPDTTTRIVPGSAVDRELLALRPLCLAPHAVVDLRAEVERRLSIDFYNLGALATMDADAYQRMRMLARLRYGLNLLDGALPRGSVEQGIDVLELMRSIHLFAAQYSYDMHEQLFVQSSNKSDVKVRIISLDQISSSIRTHGAGIINTTVNYTYGFLKKKLEIVVGFIAEEAVRSRLLADRLWLQDRLRLGRGIAGGGCEGYTWARATETARLVRRLGVAADGASFLDKLRQVVTQIGNTLGYMRMVRSAGMRSIAGSLPYIEALSVSSSLRESGVAAGCGPLVIEAAEVADEATAAVKRCFGAGGDFLAIVAHVFGKALRAHVKAAGASFDSSGHGSDPGTSTTSLFHLVVPALVVSFLQSLLVGRETLEKRTCGGRISAPRGDGFAFDDGFPIGLACILRILGQEHDFQSLHWFKAEVSMGHDELTVASLAGGTVHAGDSQKSLTSRRNLLQRELKRLDASLEAASALFGALPDEMPTFGTALADPKDGPPTSAVVEGSVDDSKSTLAT